MIAKQIKGKDFYGVLAYNQKKVDNKQGDIIDTNISGTSVIQQTKEFNIVRQLRPNVSKVVYHTSLNLPYSDKLTNAEFGCLARDYLYGMGFTDNQYIIYKHTDQEHAHIHIVANRIKYSGDIVSDSLDYKRSESLIRKLETKYNLTQLTPKTENIVLSRGEIEKCLRTGETPDRLELYTIITELLKQNVAMNEFLEKLKGKKIDVKLNKTKAGKITGISFKFKDTLYKGSKINRNLSWSNLVKQLKYEQIRNHNPLHQIDSGNERVESKCSQFKQENRWHGASHNWKPENNLGNTNQKETLKPKRGFKL